jgi:hypothetical protein
MDASSEIAAAVYLLQAGLSDYKQVADAIGVSVAHVRRIEAADDPAVRRAMRKPFGDCPAVRLRKPIRCPGCGRRIFLVPCVACRSLMDEEG